MRVKDLIKSLQTMPEDMLVVLSKDSEGNHFSPLADDFSKGYYKKNNAWSGEFSLEEKKGVKALCFWPVN